MRTRSTLAAATLLAGTTAALVASAPAPAQVHWRTVTYQVGDCGPGNAGEPKVIIWEGNGDMKSVIGCPDGTWWP